MCRILYCNFSYVAVEIICWLLSYKFLNEKKRSLVCSYPPAILFNTFFKAVAGVLLRVLTTLISLGYGTIRSCVTRYNIVLVTGLGMLYFISIAIVEVNDRLYHSEKPRNPMFALSESITVSSNLIFIGWILKSFCIPRHKLRFMRCVSDNCDAKNHSLYAFIAISLCCMGMEGAM